MYPAGNNLHLVLLEKKVRIVMAWELGAGGGHVGRLGALARALGGRGHEVALVCRFPESAQRWGFTELAGATVRAAPAWALPSKRPPPPRTWADILMGTVWAGGDVSGYVGAWEKEIEAARPDVLVTDYAPTAEVAGRRLGVRTVTVSCGFTRPPAVSPLPDLRELAGMVETPGAVADVWVGERAALRVINALLPEPLAYLGDLYAGVADVRCSFPELDHYGERSGDRYLGTFPELPHEPPQWPGDPVGEGPRVFVYAKAFPQLSALLTLLGASGLPVVAHVSGAKVPKPPTNVRVHRGPVDIGLASEQAQLCVCHAGHGTTAAMLRAGVPLLLLPLNLEQALVARRAVDLGAAVVCDPNDGEAMREGLRELLLDERFAQGARAFAKKHAGHDADAALAIAVATVVEG